MLLKCSDYQYPTTCKMTSLYDDGLRTQLRTYTRGLLEVLHKRFPEIDIETFIDTYTTDDAIMPKESLRKRSIVKTKNKNIVKLCVVSDEPINATTSQDANKRSLEYIVIAGSEYLYDPETCRVFTYSDRPVCIGTLDIETNNIVCI